jgi:hypothetical protein
LKILAYGQIGFVSRLASLNSQNRVEIIDISKMEDIPAVFKDNNKPDLVLIDRNALSVAAAIKCIKSLSVIPIVCYVEANKEHWQGLEDFTVDGYVKDTCSTGEIIARLSAICRRVKMMNSKILKMPYADQKTRRINDA